MKNMYFKFLRACISKLVLRHMSCNNLILNDRHMGLSTKINLYKFYNSIDNLITIVIQTYFLFLKANVIQRFWIR